MPSLARHTLRGMDDLVVVLNGPNLNLLGQREPEIYGHQTLGDVEALCRQVAARRGLRLEFRQSNHEGEIVDWIQELRKAAGFVVNLGAYTHTSIAIRDALAAISGPFVEVHLSNVHAREEFRHHSYVAALARAVICGCGVRGYEYGIETVADAMGARTMDPGNPSGTVATEG